LKFNFGLIIFILVFSFNYLEAKTIDNSKGNNAFQAKKERCRKGISEVLHCLDRVHNQIEIQECRHKLLKLADRVRGKKKD